MSTWRFILTPLTPLHIGAGEDMEAYEYVITDRLYKFNLDAFITALKPDEQEEFLRLVETSIPRMRNFIRQHVDLAQQHAQFNAAVSNEAKRVYETRISKAEGDPTIRPFIKSFYRPYIPGSSLKGALRTALLYDAMPKENSARKADLLEAEVFGYLRHVRGEKRLVIQDDPFRAFKIGDSQPIEESTKVHTVAVHTRLNGAWRRDVDMLVETSLAQLSDNADLKFTHTVTIDEMMYRYKPEAFSFTISGLLAACRQFYSTHLSAERRYMRELTPTANIYDQLAQWQEKLPLHACLLRLSWGSGHEAVTVAYALRDRRMAKSRRLTDDGYPLGWAQLAIFDEQGQPFKSDEK